MKCYRDIFAQIVSVENLFVAWAGFQSGKTARRDVMEFLQDVEPRLFELHRELVSGAYQHGAYSTFYVNDPKQRRIHKALVRDRVVHHALFAVLNPIFEPTFIANSFSCRVEKGIHAGVAVVENILRSVSNNNTRPCFALKCDISKFFASIDHGILIRILRWRVRDGRAMALIEEIIKSFHSDFSSACGWKGLPLGNLTSQLFANIYMNEFDQFIKHELHEKNYARYTDDFVIVSDDRAYLACLIPHLQDFLSRVLELQLHPRKTIIRKYTQGVDFLGYVMFPRHRLLRTKTRRRMFQRFAERVHECASGEISEVQLQQTMQSYIGVMSHADAHGLAEKMKNEAWFNFVAEQSVAPFVDHRAHT